MKSCGHGKSVVMQVFDNFMRGQERLQGMPLTEIIHFSQTEEEKNQADGGWGREGAKGTPPPNHHKNERLSQPERYTTINPTPNQSPLPPCLSPSIPTTPRK
ncbi:hypothetical protein CHS0354_006027 [Potamilus streckersoni]|uniref:Uncharacterized protein n=1 Tax=Potamilus streckersoni TaxID=2493646 RepID=A0AAE0S355_9BIVA|nr:hypothetical protein CHS0354_006027 [Potamilus streckersoni]